MEPTLPILEINNVQQGADHFCLVDLSVEIDALLQFEQVHRPNFFIILLLLQGTAMIHTEGQHIQLNSYHVLVNRPLVVNSMQLKTGTKGYLICFTESFFSLRYNSNVLRQFAFYQTRQIYHFEIPKENQYKWRTLLTFMLQEKKLDIQRKNALRSYLNILLHETQKCYGTAAQNNELMQYNEKVMQFIQLVDQHYVQHKNPSYYAAKLHISQSYLNKLCKGQQALTSGQIIKQRILLEAKRLLIYTSSSIAEIAYSLGFESPSYFNTFFKKGAGASPERYRKQES
ncbi:AraC family transcriptional regulator [Sphingobacterium sp. lm-10]|uniref:helix-turn-helix domain-containing protein n=1 Tax=Sphingobacterium sp. lm-10 TaxID=2944904 RepID=UPI00201FB47F|nr:AraC family transcriptional regulator [Sphingobacterium sp. lm-10]MCL7988101.1 AraC family transcriptional regulator [Sphingobacterium sp. lm-10]